VLEAATAVVAVSAHVASTLPVEKAHVIPNFIGELDGPGVMAGERPDDVPDRYVLFVGKLEPNKAPDRLVPILEAAGAAARDLPLLVAGTGRLSAEIERQAGAAGRDVRWLGWVDERRVSTLMRHAAAVLFPSRWQEPLSRVLVDGIGVGAVLIVQPTGGSGELVVDEESGLLGHTTEELGAALARVLTEPGLADRLRRGARARAGASFSEAVVLPKVEALYENVRSRS